MKMDFTTNSVSFNSPNNNGYYEGLLNQYLKHDSSVLLGWWLLEEMYYYSCPIKNNVIFKSGTPLILIDRTKQWCMYDDEFDGNYHENLYDECTSKYPYTILTLGCDDGHKGWLFKTKEEALQWYKEFVETITTFRNDFESGWEVLSYFSEKQFWIN